jgi:hypothetical protein
MSQWRRPKPRSPRRSLPKLASAEKVTRTSGSASDSVARLLPRSLATSTVWPSIRPTSSSSPRAPPARPRLARQSSCSPQPPCRVASMRSPFAAHGLRHAAGIGKPPPARRLGWPSSSESWFMSNLSGSCCLGIKSAAAGRTNWPNRRDGTQYRLAWPSSTSLRVRRRAGVQLTSRAPPLRKTRVDL